MADDLKEVRALVTGAGSGIGRAIARRLAAGGCRVAATDVQEDRVKEVARMICDEGGDAFAIRADVANAVELARFGVTVNAVCPGPNSRTRTTPRTNDRRSGGWRVGPDP